MTTESTALQELTLKFGREWYEAEDRQTKERLRRSFMLGLVFMAEDQRGVSPAAEDAWQVALAGLHTSQAFVRCRRLLEAGITFERKSTPLPASPLELLQSLDSSDGRYKHDLHVPIPLQALLEA